mmetsp:Transcript_48658/g.79177  ORF Transcript_48658/g.79177 Transcript_48658/m.79177 type:complete len:124 (-) Transcript_48658:1119-1490(-)
MQSDVAPLYNLTTGPLLLSSSGNKEEEERSATALCISGLIPKQSYKLCQNLLAMFSVRSTFRIQGSTFKVPTFTIPNSMSHIQCPLFKVYSGSRILSHCRVIISRGWGIGRSKSKNTAAQWDV